MKLLCIRVTDANHTRYTLYRMYEARRGLGGLYRVNDDRGVPWVLRQRYDKSLYCGINEIAAFVEVPDESGMR